MSNLLNYTNYDFDDLVTALQDRLKNQDSWKDIYRSSTGQMLIELLAYVLNLGLYYTERRAEESYLGTALNRSSVLALVSLLNYTPKRKTSSTGNLTFSIAIASSKIVYISKYIECESVEGYKFLTNESATIDVGQTSVAVSSIQGELKTIAVTSTGIVNQEYLISNTGVENSADTSNPTLRILVNSEEWTKVDSFINSDSTSKHYRIIVEMDDTVTVKFGDNVNGKAPDDGSTITIKYIDSDGLDGNVTYVDKITILNDTIYDEDGDAVTVTVTNSGSFLGGDAAEDIEEIRYEAPRVFKTGDRAVSKSDFITILENYAGVANANVWGENEEALAAGVSVDYTMLNKVNMCILLQDWALPDNDFKDILSAYIYNKSMLTVKYEFITPEILLTIPTLRVKVVEGYSLSQTQTDIETALAAQFLLGGTTNLGAVIKYSSVISALNDLTAVSYITMVLEIKKALSDSYDSTYDYAEALEALDIKPGSVRLFVDDIYITVDEDGGDSSGSFDGVVGGYTISNSSINYSTGVIELDITPSPASSIYVRYQQNENSNIVPSFKQISKLDNVDIVSISIDD